MSSYLVTGGKSLKGNVKIFGAKNSSFKLMLAALLASQPCQISNICFIRDVIAVKQLIESLGGQVLVGDKKTLTVSGQDLRSWEVGEEFGQKTRASSMIIPILLHRFKKARVPLPGGDNIGNRPLDRHFQGLKEFGADIKLEGNFVEAQVSGQLKGTEYIFAKNTHTGTETLILAACLASGTSVLKNAAEEPEVDDLISFLNKMGASIKRTGYREITVEGVTQLHSANHRLMPDRNDAVTFAVAALATDGDVMVEEAREEHLKAFLAKVAAAGGGYEVKEEGIRFFYKEPLKATNLETSFHPGFMTDWQALWVTLMTQAKGVSLIHERVFENRFAYVKHLRAMGANIELFNPQVNDPKSFYEFNWEDVGKDSYHAAKITGPVKLYATNLRVDDIRAGATLTLAALVAHGQSTIEGVELIERGYENLDGRLMGLGAQIVKRS